jgi:hypothetical protein
MGSKNFLPPRAFSQAIPTMTDIDTKGLLWTNAAQEMYHRLLKYLLPRRRKEMLLAKSKFTSHPKWLTLKCDGLIRMAKANPSLLCIDISSLASCMDSINFLLSRAFSQANPPNDWHKYEGITINNIRSLRNFYHRYLKYLSPPRGKERTNAFW